MMRMRVLSTVSDMMEERRERGETNFTDTAFPPNTTSIIASPSVGREGKGMRTDTHCMELKEVGSSRG